jgi:hypothetical protein
VIVDTDGMDGRYIEPRKMMWAVAEITWEDDNGTSFRVPAILDDTSQSGACVRMKRALAVGAHISVKWQREQFSAVTRNCRVESTAALARKTHHSEKGTAEAARAAEDPPQALQREHRRRNSIKQSRHQRGLTSRLREFPPWFCHPRGPKLILRPSPVVPKGKLWNRKNDLSAFLAS